MVLVTSSSSNIIMSLLDEWLVVTSGCCDASIDEGIIWYKCKDCDAALTWMGHGLMDKINPRFDLSNFDEPMTARKWVSTWLNEPLGNVEVEVAWS